MFRMYGQRLTLKNRSVESRDLVVIKKESQPELVKFVMVDQNPVDWDYEDGDLNFWIRASPNARVEIAVHYRESLDSNRVSEGFAYAVKVCLRRALSEIRDNYLSQSDFLTESMKRIRRRLGRVRNTSSVCNDVSAK